MSNTRDSGTKVKKIHIFVNRRRFDQDQGVRATMTGAEIAALVDVPKEKAVVRREKGNENEEIPIDTPTAIHEADHFLVTRKTVEGGFGA